MNSKGCVVLLLVLLVVAATFVSAQTFRGTILGTVSDTSGAVVPGATVKARNTGTGLERTTQTTAEGNYSISELPIGTYNVTVTQPGFQSALMSKSDHAMPLEFFRDILEEHFGEPEVQRQVETALNWGRYSDIFTYDPESDRLSLDQPVGPADAKEQVRLH